MHSIENKESWRLYQNQAFYIFMKPFTKKDMDMVLQPQGSGGKQNLYIKMFEQSDKCW